jgi:FAD binding domain
MDREGHPHDGSAMAWEGRPRFFIDTKKFTGKEMMAYGQTAITEDLYAARDTAGGEVIDEAANVRPHELNSDRPYITYEKEGSRRIDCDVAGCDGQQSTQPSVARLADVVLRIKLKPKLGAACIATCAESAANIIPARNQIFLPIGLPFSVGSGLLEPCADGPGAGAGRLRMCVQP